MTEIDNAFGYNGATFKSGEFIFVRTCLSLVSIFWRERVWTRFLGRGVWDRNRTMSFDES